MIESQGWWQKWARFAGCLILATSLFHAPVRTHAQTPEGDDPATITSLIREVTDYVTKSAYKTEPKAIIYTKALKGLVTQLGESAKSQEKDLSTMIDDAAEAEFIRILQGIASTPGQRLSLRELAERALQAYCRQHDAYTRYVRSDELKLVKLMGKTTGSAVGMSVMEKDDGFYCYPLPGSPAEAAGVKAGQKLLSVDGKPVEGRSLEYLAAVIRGAPGTEVSLRVEHTFGRAQTIRVTRETLSTPSVLTEKRVASFILRVRKFSKELLTEARAALAQVSTGSTLTIDFQGCPGGDLDVALEFAGMFMEPGEPIVTVRRRGQPDEVISANKPREFKPAGVIMLQDSGTASGAELVIAALVASKTARGASQGTKSYGKGMTQNGIDLRGGGRLIVTTGELIAPQGQTWDKTGLLPSLENRGRIFPKD
ncbi:S41 family peptidase [Roseimicrobium sp. ORNL1]|uniref:S41 family peptidase n=1 Tax=Roseimicrobium sp. ORNL1 TaxID=2711231 RepID=UPI0013E16027|nr:S41 family peptidase [Roseimicrobium sp. ORNL1]QIF05801.1 PDZ domain-containing protein [Roseimicrobium sp. ORNL1]